MFWSGRGGGKRIFRYVVYRAEAPQQAPGAVAASDIAGPAAPLLSPGATAPTEDRASKRPKIDS